MISATHGNLIEHHSVTVPWSLEENRRLRGLSRGITGRSAPTASCFAFGLCLICALAPVLLAGGCHRPLKPIFEQPTPPITWPADPTRARIRYVGNTASFGAKRFLLCDAEREYAERVIRGVQHVDLSLDPEFQMEFSAAMLFPEPG